jgi:hypothetical protein
LDEIAFQTISQLRTPQQRAALILGDVLDWSAKNAADLLDLSVPAVNGALQRARARLRARLPSRKPPWPAHVDAILISLKIPRPAANLFHQSYLSAENELTPIQNSASACKFFL